MNSPDSELPPEITGFSLQAGEYYESEITAAELPFLRASLERARAEPPGPGRTLEYGKLFKCRLPHQGAG